ncbi:MAG: putative aminohydrolase SsnA [Defluviitaleaceae bacterium]|nr:putative aminohydrolase SsnA [Defluviitaleaceae bacterium]
MLLVGDGKLITRGENNQLIEDGCVALEDTLIKEIGDTTALRKKYKDAEFISAKGGIIMPGFINAHNHIYSAFARGLSIKGHNPKNFLEILDGLWWTIDRHLLLENTHWSAMATYLDCIKNGCTTVFDHHASYGGIKGSLFTIADAAKKLGVRTSLCYEVSDRDGEDKMKEAVAENSEFIKFAMSDDTDMIKGMMGMHASFTLSDKTLAHCREHTPEGIGVHIHVAEGMDDVYDSLKKYGKRVIQRLYDQDLLGQYSVTGHCIHVNGLELDIIKATDTMVVHNPESNMGNAVGIPPCMEMMKRGILLGLGTDGYTNDMLESEKVANVIHKHVLCDPGAAWGEVPQMLFVNNAKIANRSFNTKLGVLEEGAAADIIITDYDPLTPMNADNCDGHILFGMSGRSVITTIINGVVKMKDRKLVGIDSEHIMAKCREQASDMAKRINSR